MSEITFISGATGGIGKAFSAECAKLGYNLFLTGRSREKLEGLKGELEQENQVNIDLFECDLTNPDSRKEMVEYIKEKGYKVKRIIHVAGVDTQKPFLEYTREKLLFQLRVNVESAVDLTHLLLKERAEEVEIITIASMSGVSPMPNFQIYSASKSMLINLFTALHYELRKERVKITTVCPGGVYTREDIIEDIKGQGLWGSLSAKKPEYIAKKSLVAVRKNKVKYIPGFFNKLLNFIMKIAPKGIVLRFIDKRWKKIRKDAF